jgi:hypothetical protein
MSDPFLRALQGDWQSQDHGAAEVLTRLRRNRWTPHIVLAAELLACAGALLVGLWFAWVALHGAQLKLLYALSAGVLLLSAPGLALAGIKARRASLAWADETPESLLKVGMRRAESTLRAIRVGRWHLAIIAVFVAALWVVESVGLLHAFEFLAVYTATCFLVSGVSWFWMMRAEGRARREYEACVRLLAAIQIDPENAG